MTSGGGPWSGRVAAIVLGGGMRGNTGGDICRRECRAACWQASGEGGIEGAVHSLEDMLINNKWLVDESSGCGNTVSRSF